jgi:hypothetical protein
MADATKARPIDLAVSGVPGPDLARDVLTRYDLRWDYGRRRRHLIVYVPPDLTWAERQRVADTLAELVRGR